ncbi:MAG: hypothetical protein II837_04005 [Treponema sp.]|nr:hypothetical protein [Treponema sp.]MBQ7165886.1 hypothetical protein [Treponema sp.]
MAKVSVKIDGDSKGAEQAIKKVKDQLGKLADSKTAKGLSTLSLGFSGITQMAGTARDALQKVAAAVNECTEAYRVQANAEIRLEQAARNNPYLDSSSVTNLKNFASEIQSMTTYGDEELLPFMAQLAAAGRTEEQVMDIMKASVDLAASGTMSLDSAVKALNGTYQGNVGTLGKQIAGVKSLTKEQLANGEAVKLVAENYKGMAEETARATGAAKQLKIAWGDFKEHLGSGFEAIIAPINRGITGILTSVNNTISGLKEAIRQEKIYKQIQMGNSSGLDSSQTKVARDTAGVKKTAAAAWLAENRNDVVDTFAQLSVDDEGNQTHVTTPWGFWANQNEMWKDLNAIAAAMRKEKKARTDAENLWVKRGEQLPVAFQKYLDALVGYNESMDEWNNAVAAHSNKLKEEQEAEQKRLAEEWSSEVTEAVAKARSRVSAVDSMRELEKEAGRDWSEAEYAKRLDDAYYEAYKALLEQSSDAARMKNESAVMAFSEEAKKAARNASKYSDKTTTSTGSSGTTEKERDIIAEAVKAYADAENELIGKRNLTGGYEAGGRDSNEFLYNSLYKILENLVKENPNAIQISASGNLQTDTGDQRLLDLLEKFNGLASNMRGYEKEDSNNEIKEALLQQLLEVQNQEEEKLSDILKKRKSELESYAKDVAGMYAEESEERQNVETVTAAAMADLDKQITEAKRAESRERIKIALEEAQAMTAAVQSYVDKSAQLINYLSDLSIKAADAEKASKMADLEEQYENGIIAETDYVEKQKEIEKEAADQKYKAELWQWGSNLAQMAVSGAQAVLSALSTQPIYAGIAMAGLVGAMTAAQMGVAIANKPKAPSFAEGGIVPGSSWTGDNVQANVNSGEMILTRAQQADLWKRLNSGQSGWGSVAVNNYMGKDASIRTRRNERGLTIDVLDAHINRQMAMGGYDSGFAGHDMSSKGVRYL